MVDKEAGRRWRRLIRDVLNTHWNPIGVDGLPDDEYDTDAGKVAAMLRNGASDRELAEYLHWAETVHMGLEGNERRLARVVAAIRSIGFVH